MTLIDATDRHEAGAEGTSVCQACGACCAYSADWPRFSTEDEDALARIPPALVDDGMSKMRCHGPRCAALTGEVGIATSCAIYCDRPDVCRACEPGDDACAMARAAYGLAPIEPAQSIRDFARVCGS